MHPFPPNAIFHFRGDYHFLSNMWPCYIVLPAENHLPAMEFASVENAYIAAKTLSQTQREIVQTLDPKAAKKYSYTDEFEMRPDWTDEKRLDIMRLLLAQKFSDQNPELLRLLIDTNPCPLFEGNDWGDAFFGVDLETGEGANHLGRMLMKRRQYCVEFMTLHQ